MHIEAYGIKLIRLQHGHIELVRQWRNSPTVQSQMEYRQFITPQMQEQWFTSIDNEFNNFFLIEVKGELIGVISATKIDWENNETGNGGIFIATEKYIETDYPARAALLLTDLGFYLGMQKNYVRILTDNKRSIAFNTQIGYELIDGQEGVLNKKYVLHKDDYFNKALKLRSTLNANKVIKCFLDEPTHPAQKLMLQRTELIPLAERAIFEIKIAGQ